MINRIYRIGQQKSVVIKKYAMKATIEERRLTHRKSAGGLFTEEINETDVMAVQSSLENTVDAESPDPVAHKAATDLRRLARLRHLVGLE